MKAIYCHRQMVLRLVMAKLHSLGPEKVRGQNDPISIGKISKGGQQNEFSMTI